MYWFVAHFVMLMLVSGYNSKTLGVCVVYALALNNFYPDSGSLVMMDLFFLPAVVIASFRD